jgi:hypothetical protein
MPTYPVSPSSAEVPADWKSLSWTPAAERVYNIAAGLILLRGPASCGATTGCPRRPPRSWSPTAGSIPATQANSRTTAICASRPQQGPHQEVRRQVHPHRDRGQFKAVCPYLSNILVRDADRNFCTAPIANPPPSDLTRPTSRRSSSGPGERPGGEVVRGGRLGTFLGRADRRVCATAQAGLQRWQGIKRFRLLPRET